MMNLMVGGPLAQLPADWAALPGDWIGIDRGALRLLDAGLTPLLAAGDFDSLTPAEFARVKQAVPAVVRVPAEKDETDTELGVRLALDRGATVIRILGATGGRLDHLLANLFLPTQPRFAAAAERLIMLDKQNRVRFYAPGTHVLTEDAAYRYLAIVPLTAVTHLTIRGAKYALTDWSSQTPFAWASNEFVAGASVTISWATGLVAVIESNDAQGQTVDN